jgi:predicted ATPase
MIRSLRLKNFKSIVDAKIELGKINVLIGRNAVGKSYLLSFFDLLREGAGGKLNPKINIMGGIHEVKHYHSNLNIEWEIFFQDIQNEPHVFYQGQLAQRGTTSYTVNLEELARPPYEGYQQPYKYLSVSDGHVRILKSPKSDKDESQEAYDESDQELMIAQIRHRSRYPILAEIRQQIADWQIFHGFGDVALSNIRNPQFFNVVDPLRLEPTGANLVSILQKLQSEPEYQEVNKRLFQILEVVYPDFERLITPIVAGGIGSLSYQSKDFPRKSIPAISMSDGQLRFIGLAVLLLLPNPPALIAIDEPEIGLHPEMLPILAKLLHSAASQTQLIITTHSAQLVDQLQAEDVIVVEKDNGISQFRRLNMDSLRVWLERYTLGKLWTMGKLEAQ